MFYAFDRASVKLARFSREVTRDHWVADRPQAQAVPEDFTAIPKARWETVDGVEVGTPSRADTPLATAQQELAARWMPLAHKLTVKFCRANRIRQDSAIRDELTSAAMHYLLKAVRAFDPDLGYSPGTIIGTAVTRGLVRQLELCRSPGMTSGPGRAVLKNVPKVSRLADGMTADRHAGCMNDRPRHWTERTRERVLAVIEEETDERCAYLWDLYAFEGLTLRQVGKRVGLSGQAVLNALQSIGGHEILRERIEQALEYV